MLVVLFFFSSRRRHTRLQGDWSSDVCSSDLVGETCITCTVDCGLCSACGDGVCDASRMETCSTCPGDCGMCPPKIGRASCRERVCDWRDGGGRKKRRR